LAILGEVEAGIAHLLYGRLDWSFRQLFPDTAEGPFLERWASIFGITRRTATQAWGNASWPTSISPSFIGEGAIAVRGDRTLYNVMRGAYDVDGVITVGIQADQPGIRGNCEPGVQLTLATSVTGVTPLGTVDAPGISGGAPEETDALLLQRLLTRIRFPPHGGTATDYIQWALSQPGVTRAWCAPLEQGVGTVTVRFMTDDTTPDGIPTPADVARVGAYIRSQAPVTAGVYVLAPIPDPLDIHIQQLEPDNPAIREGIEAELRDLMRRETAPGELLHLSRIYARINAAPGVIRFHLIAPAGDIQPPSPGHIITLGAVTYA